MFLGNVVVKIGKDGKVFKSVVNLSFIIEWKKKKGEDLIGFNLYYLVIWYRISYV